MRATSVLESPVRLARREVLLGGFTVAMAVVGLASLAAVALAGSGADLRLPGAGTDAAATDRSSLVAVGYGEARAPAEVATLQFVIGSTDFAPGMMVPAPTGGGEPGEGERAAMEPIVQALSRAGVTADDLQVVVSPAIPASQYGGGGGSFGTRFDLIVRQPTTERVNEIVNAAGAAAIEQGLGLTQVGVAYGLADCSALTRQARERAVEDAQANARQQADLLGSLLGELLLSSDVPPAGADDTFGFAPAQSCNPTGSAPERSDVIGYGGTLTVPPFDPARPAEATAQFRIGLTFALAEV